MNTERWRQLTDTFDGAISRPPEERARFLNEACAGDDEMRAEVERLIAQLEAAGDFLERPAIGPLVPAGTAAALDIGRAVAGRYRVETLLGRGGMGEVYRVYDTLLGEAVALKLLRPELAANPSIVRRFQREARLARRVAHPNVCRVFETGVDTATVDAGAGGALHFFTMQLVEGESLAQRIRRAGRMSKEQALPLIRQMAAGLAAAHQAGVIHRDFKSSNVMLESAGGEAGSSLLGGSPIKVVITDFGLARAEGPLVQLAGAPGDSLLEQATLTAQAQVAGTVAYMSPEQLLGGQVTASSDLYSLGVVLYEMATGELPFEDRDIIKSAVERSSGGAPDPRRVVKKLDPAWAAAITRCLQRNPAGRFASVSELEQFLKPAWRPPMAYWSRREWMRAGGVAAVSGGALSLIPSASRLVLQNSTVAEGAEALLSPIANFTGEPRFDGITELFRNQLEQSVHLRIVERGKLSATLRQMGQAETSTDPKHIQEAAWRANTALWVSGTVSRIGADYALNVQFETRGSQPAAPRSKEIRSFSAPDEAALMRSVREAALWIRESVGESASSISSFDRLPSDVTTSSWDALTLYARGQQYFMQQDFESAILEYRAALTRDPEFTLAKIRLADLLTSQSGQTESFRLWRSVMANLNTKPVTRSEELYARAMFANDTGDMDAAERFFRTWANEYPHEWRAPFYRMLPLVLNGHAREALQVLGQLAALMPDFADIYVQMISCHLVLGQLPEARELVPVVKRKENSTRADMREAYVRFCEGDSLGYLSALRAIQRDSKTARGRIDAITNEAMLYLDAGLPEQAVRCAATYLAADSAVTVTGQKAALLAVQAWAEMLSGKRSDAVNHARQVLTANHGAILVTLAGSIFARVGAAAYVLETLAVCDEFEGLPLYDIARNRIQGEVHRARGEDDLAISAFRSAANLEPPILHRQYLIEALPKEREERRVLSLNVVRTPWQNLRPPPLHNLGSVAIALAGLRQTEISAIAFAQSFQTSSRQLQFV